MKVTNPIFASLVMSTLLITATSMATAAEKTKQAAPRPLPMTLSVHVDLANAGWLNLTVSTAKLPWTIDGCESSARGACKATRKIALSEAQRRAYTSGIMAIRAMPLCEPVTHRSGDHQAFVDGPGLTAKTWLPAQWLASGKIPDLTVSGRAISLTKTVSKAATDPCSADQRFVFFLAQTFSSQETMR